ncbi:RNA-binding protein 28-like [Oppia nitens]|uniref:RNA-binding protein 28-like n=1 Tax=Oppia nitens TaxID=1686743 RepID=UPI0023DC41DE|nr:RNA-binding protein 28-like [Oppia nitens]
MKNKNNNRKIKEEEEVEEVEEDDDSDDESMEFSERRSDKKPIGGNMMSTNKMSLNSRETNPKKPLDDASEERTIFIRNLSFETTGETLNEFMQTFGETLYCKLCIDRMTEHSKGTAFVKFKNKEDADRCLESSSADDNDMYLDGRQLFMSMAVTRNKLKDIQEKRSEKDRDKRNLYLAKEGLIYPESTAAEGVSQSDLKKRLALETRKRKMLQNNHHFVSDTRLCVHNLPLDCDNKKLRNIFVEAVSDKSAKITECRVMYDKKKNEKKFGKSKGFAFVELSQHIHALKCLRQLNNNPNIFTPQKRPIVEFSIENKVALNKKKHRMEKQKNNLSKTVENNEKTNNNKNNNKNNNNNNNKNNNNNIKQQKRKEVDNSEELPEEDIDYGGLMSRPNKQNEKIKTPKVNKKLGEMQKQLKIRKKLLKKDKIKTENKLRHKQKLEKRKTNKNETKEIQDLHDLHYRKRKNIFKVSDNNNNNKHIVVSKPNKRVKWYIQ